MKMVAGCCGNFPLLTRRVNSPDRAGRTMLCSKVLHLAGMVASLLTAPLKLPAEICVGRREHGALLPLQLSGITAGQYHTLGIMVLWW